MTRRTHESVLTASFEIEESVERGDGWYARKFKHHGSEVMEKRFIVLLASDKETASLQTQYNALGSFHEHQLFEITREQFEFLKGIWK